MFNKEKKIGFHTVLNKDPRISFDNKFKVVENKDCQNIRDVNSRCNDWWLKIMKLIIMQKKSKLVFKV